MRDNYKATPDIGAFHSAVNRLRNFFINKKFTEVHTQDRLSILAACEDPTTVATYQYNGQTWPLPQTGQMWLEYELLTKPHLPGVFCVSTSYRAEKNPIPGRHEIIFPMFEFELHGTLDDLRNFEMELCEYMGLGKQAEFKRGEYEKVAQSYGTSEISSLEEKRIMQDYGKVFFLEKFPERTSPFWNMKKDGAYAHKIDVIIGGQETIGSAERSTNAREMREQFHSISQGRYAGLLYELFGEARVEKELESFLSLPFFPRSGGGIGMTRMMQALASC